MLEFYHFPIVAAGLFLVFLLTRFLRLRSIPGPILTSFTDLWRLYYQRRTGFDTKLRKLHEKYGPILRLGPNTVCIADPTEVSTIYTMHGEFKKADSYAPIRGYVNGKVVGSFVDLQDEQKVTGIRRALGSTFAIKNILDYENDVDEVVSVLIERLSKSTPVDVIRLYRRFQLDFLNKAAFSESPHVLSTDGDLTPYDIRHRLIHARKWQPAPNLEYLLYKTRIMNMLRSNPAPPLWARLAATKMQERQSEKIKVEGEKRDLLDKYRAASKQYPEHLPPDIMMRIVTSTISAGYDTTSQTLLLITSFLINSPRTYERLQQEIEKAEADGQLSNPPKWTEVNKLEYLDAYIKETLRCLPVVPQPMERVVPAGGAMVCGKYLPEGTWVGAAAAAVHYDKACYGEDANEFRPERWIEADHEKRMAMERGWLAFGAGKRNCIGKHIAELELKKTVPAILMNFKVRSADGQPIDPADTRLVSEKPVMVTFEPRT